MKHLTGNKHLARFIRENKQIFIDMYNKKYPLPGSYTYVPLKNVVSVKPVDEYSVYRKTCVLFLVDNVPTCVMTFDHAWKLVAETLNV